MNASFTDDGEHLRRLEELFALESGFVANMLRKFGVPARDIDDGIQQVFIVLARKLVGLPPGAERAFLSRTAIHVAAHARRSLARKRELFGDLPELEAREPRADDLIDVRRARQRLDRVLASMDPHARTVFVLHELEHRTMSEIATTLESPPGTVASRLRRARAFFQRELSSSMTAAEC